MFDVQRFKRCISEFVEENEEQAQWHLDAAEEAVADWNRFVRIELE